MIKILDYEEIKKKYDEYADKLHKLIELGIISEKGDLIKRERKKLNN